MSAIEQRARELLAEAFACDVSELSAAEVRAVHAVLAWSAALTPPEGYVLVPVEPTAEMIEAICTAHGSGGWPQGYSRLAQYIRREHAGDGYAAMLAARPEVEP